MSNFGAANVGWLDSVVLNVGPDRASQPFAVPFGFTGHVYLHGIGGNHHAIFAVGCDGNTQFSGAGGQLTKIQHSEMADTTIEEVAVNIWRLVGLPQFGPPEAQIKVAIVGVKMAP